MMLLRELIFLYPHAETLYMSASLGFANYRPDADDLPSKDLVSLIQAMRPANSPPPTTPSDEIVRQALNSGLLDYGQRIRAALERFTTGHETDIRELRETAKAGIGQMQVTLTGPRLSEDGNLEHFLRAFTVPIESLAGVFLTLLLDSEYDFGKNLRRCRLRSCGRFFFVPPKRRGGRIPAYCPNKNCQRRQDTLRARRRAKEYRAQQYFRERVKPK
jgi:hypothetical protein